MVTLWAKKVISTNNLIIDISYVLFITPMAINHFILLTWMSERISFLGEEKLFLYPVEFCKLVLQIKLTKEIDRW